jgi:hypothetical protein
VSSTFTEGTSRKVRIQKITNTEDAASIANNVFSSRAASEGYVRNALSYTQGDLVAQETNTISYLHTGIPYNYLNVGDIVTSVAVDSTVEFPALRRDSDLVIPLTQDLWLLWVADDRFVLLISTQALDDYQDHSDSYWDWATAQDFAVLYYNGYYYTESAFDASYFTGRRTIEEMFTTYNNQFIAQIRSDLYSKLNWLFIINENVDSNIRVFGKDPDNHQVEFVTNENLNKTYFTDNIINNNYLPVSAAKFISLVDFLNTNADGYYYINDILKYDYNHDGKVDSVDAELLINVIADITAADNPEFDVNGDGEIDVSDITALVNYINSNIKGKDYQYSIIRKCGNFYTKYPLKWGNIYVDTLTNRTYWFNGTEMIKTI